MAHKYDIIIVGSGVAGALCAWKLSQYGRHKILILEAGDNGITHGQRIEFHHRMDEQGNRGDMYAPYMDLESRLFAPVAEKAQRELTDQKNDPKNYYEYTNASRDAFKAGYNRMVGGSTWSWRGNTPRFIPSDFKLKSNFGRGRDWPIDYHELEPWYCQAEEELGVSGNHEEWDGLHGGYRSRPFPMRGIPLGYADQQVKKRIEGKTVRGTEIRVVTTPQARNSADYDGRPACEGHSNCIPLCPIQAKYDATVHLRRMVSDPRVQLKKAAVVTRLERGKDGEVSEVYYKDWRSADPQKEHSVSGSVVVLAAHAIETPKILLMSKNLANRSGQVGRNLMDHVQFEVTAFFPEPLYPFRGPQSISSIEAFRDGAFRKTRSAFRMTIGNDGWGRTGSPATVIDNLLKTGQYGSALPGAIADQIPKMLRLSFSTEMLAESSNRIELSTNKDALGIPRPLFTFDVGDYTRVALREGFETAKDLFGVMGATVMGEQTMPDGKWNTAAHIMGTCVMGDDPASSVVNRWGRAHDVPNLWIVGSSVFATSATANPTLTLAALSLRTAAAINREMV
ncbi:MAG TPA: GMC family oxidoreductase [Vicinamibacterales bacterium]|nr:GMC family oxidoreductase [Vicinamibacterales bacterium]